MVDDELKNPYTRRLNAEAWDAGVKAHESGEGRIPPREFEAPHALLVAFERGWDARAELVRAERLARAVEHQELAVEHQQLAAVRTRGPRRGPRTHVPEGEDISELMVLVKPRPVPCPCCRRERLDDLRPACVLNRSGKARDVAYLRCRACNGCVKCNGVPFKVPVRQPQQRV